MASDDECTSNTRASSERAAEVEDEVLANKAWIYERGYFKKLENVKIEREDTKNLKQMATYTTERCTRG